MQPPRRRRLVTADEARLWREAMRDTVPLDGPAVLPRVPAPPPEPPPPPPPPAPPPVLPAAPSAGARAGKATPVHLGTHPWPAGIDRRTDQRLRRGRLEIDGTLDLHGMTQATAHGALAGFLHRCALEHKRCILVITGKGSAEGGGVLRQAVPRWLAEPPLRPLVLTLHPAQPRHGGDGALYVLLKRHR